MFICGYVELFKMKILGIETSNKYCGVALGINGKIVVTHNLDIGLKHTDLLHSLIDRTLKKFRLTPKDLDGIAVDIGPGSFTGVRIGLSVARTMAQILKISLIGITSLDCLTYNVLSDNNDNGKKLVCPMIDALRNEVYTGLNQFGQQQNGIGWKNVIKYQLSGIETVLENILKLNHEKLPVVFVGNAAEMHWQIIKHKFGTKIVPILTPDSVLRAENLVVLGTKKLQKQGDSDYRKILPFYIRLSEAEVRYKQRCQQLQS